MGGAVNRADVKFSLGGLGHVSLACGGLTGGDFVYGPLAVECHLGNPGRFTTDFIKVLAAQDIKISIGG